MARKHRASPLAESGLDVFDAALDRVRWLYDEFDGNVSVGSSGGKDSTVVVELCRRVAKEKGAGPVKVWWLDQECEYQSTVDYQRWMSEQPDVDFRWFQVPFDGFNATNHDNPWLHVWGEGEEWVREKEPDSYHDEFVDRKGNPIHRFKPVMNEIGMRVAEGGAVLSGMRAEESPARRLTLTSGAVYKWVTWAASGSAHKPYERFWRFSPIYDWSYQDVWKAIDANGWRYNSYYDQLFRYGAPLNKMRVSSYHHETAVDALHYLQEIEPQTWEAATRRLSGLAIYTHQTASDMRIDRLPYMFKSWEEYFEHLVDNLVPDPEHRKMYRKQHDRCVRMLPGMKLSEVSKMMVRAVVAGDLYGTKADNFIVTWRKTYNEETYKKLVELRQMESEKVVTW